MSDLVFSVATEEDGGYSASCELPDGVIATQGNTWEELELMVLDAVAGYFEGRADRPARVRLHFVRDSVLSMGAEAPAGR
jgi:predicted RNase H-like HicB family nuclease